MQILVNVDDVIFLKMVKQIADKPGHDVQRIEH